MNDKYEGIKNNLMAQVNKSYKEINQGGYSTRARYKQSAERFCGFLAQEYKLQKFKNIKEKHILAYVNYMKMEGRGASTIKTDLAGIRFTHRIIGGKNPIPNNEKLDLEKRIFNKIDRGWTKKEIEEAKNYAIENGRMDVYHSINLSSKLGYRVEGVCLATYNHLKNALINKEIYIKEKGGLERYVPITNKKQVEAIKEVMQYAKEKGRIGGSKVLVDNVKYGTEKQIKSIQNWIYNHRNKFQDNSLRSKADLKDFKQRVEREGFKIRSMNLSFHGLRYTYAQERYSDFKSKGISEHNARIRISKELGHHRADVTNIYLSQKS